MENTLILFGAGHMGSAIARGLLRAGKHNIRLVDPNVQRLRHFSSLGIKTETVCHSLSPEDVVLLAIPPQDFGRFAASTECVHQHPGLVISVMAGVRIASIQHSVGTPNVVRSIPNTPAEVYEGMTIFCRSPSMGDELASKARAILGSFGKAIEVSDETLIDPATALCGGGPAFVAYFADALLAFAVNAGLPESTALAVTIQLFRGTSALLESTAKSPMELCNEVMTPGGTTERGIRHFDKSEFSRIVQEALSKSSERSTELGGAISHVLSQIEVTK